MHLRGGVDFCSRVPTSLNSHLGLHDSRPNSYYSTLFPSQYLSSDRCLDIKRSLLLLVSPGSPWARARCSVMVD